MSDETKIKLISALKTFASVFIVTAAAFIVDSQSVEWTTTFLLALVSAGLRAAIASLINPIIPLRLGGKKV